jgi:phospholipid-translocating P-type ATPase (flippase)
MRTVLSDQDDDEKWYLAGRGGQNAFLTWVTFMILLNSLIPISLYVMMEVVKLIQASLINNDILMYSEERDVPAMVRSSKLNEELGQVEYIFSDKTGTLTCNMMEFRKFSCLSLDNDKNATVESYGESHKPGEHSDVPSGSHGPSSPLMAPFSFYDSRINRGAWKGQKNREEILFLFQAMAVCNTVIPEKESDGTIRYQASSPDEMCLTKAARQLGVELVARSENTLTVVEDGEIRKWEILNVIDFTSARKRMSVVCRDPQRRLMLITKGADSVLLERLKKDSGHARMIEKTESILSTFAGDGLRTLVFAKADLTEDLYKRWKRKFDTATTAIHEREEKVFAVAEEIEKELDLVGTTAIEDKLQENVPQTIELLSKAGIKLWVLTGDKQETALNIGYACSLLHSHMGLFTFDDCTPATIRHALEKYVHDVEAAAVESGQEIGLIIQGTMLQYVLPTKDDDHANEHETDFFVTLATKCKAVICCRVSPMQKAQVVQAVKDRVAGVTLAIGDGANDVSMLQTAHVGVGITGLEGLQAARSSDYSFANFQHLQRLLLVHGRWSYRRIAKLIIFTFYKNMSLYMTQFWFALFNRFTGLSLYDPWALAMYNLAFTAFPIMALAIFDRDVEAKRVLSAQQFPELYADGIKNKLFNTKEFWTYTVTALIHSLMCFYLPMLSWGELAQPGSGRSFGTIGHAIGAYTSVLVVVTAKCGLETNTWTLPNIALTLLSIWVWYLFLFLYCSLWRYVDTFNDFANWYGADTPVMAMPTYYLVVIVVVIASLLRDWVWKFYRRNYNPALGHCVQLFERSTVEGADFDRYDVKRAYPWLFPKHEVKVFKPSLSEGVGHHRFRADVDREMDTMPKLQESQFFSPGTKPGQRTVKISAIIEDDL